MKYSKYSAVVIGSGISGLYTALRLQKQMNTSDGILLVSKSRLNDNNSFFAQGGIVGVLKENEKDSVTLHVSDTIKAGKGLSELNTVKFISENSDKVIKDLLNFGVEFDRDENGKFTFTLEAAHSVKRILHSGGDATGRKIEEGLLKSARANSDIDIYENTVAVDLLIDNDKTCKGVVLFHDNINEYETVYSSAVVLATGGIGQLYKYTTNPTGATGDGIALAYNAGAILQDLEFVQFHPTALAIDNRKNRFLISEAVRGEGAKLVDTDGKEFMQKYDENKELAPRDVVTRSIYNEMSERDMNNVYLNATVIDKEVLLRRFPTICNVCLKNGIDISKDFIPVAPAAHYFMGGIKADVNGQTSIPNLYAVGEVSSTGLHGGNRLASNSLLECVVCAYNVAESIANKSLKAPTQISECVKLQSDKYNNEILMQELDISSMKKELQNIMWNGCGIIRDKEKLSNALLDLELLSSKFPRFVTCRNKEEYEFKNMLLVSKLIMQSALNRNESRGAHCRTDYPIMEETAIHTIVEKTGELDFVK